MASQYPIMLVCFYRIQATLHIWVRKVQTGKEITLEKMIRRWSYESLHSDQIRCTRPTLYCAFQSEQLYCEVTEEVKDEQESRNYVAQPFEGETQSGQNMIRR